MSPWTSNNSCKTLSGSCGKGQIVHTRRCVQEGKNGGKTCSEYLTEKSEDCYVNCLRPKVVDWGYPNDAPNIPIGSPLKGWYDASGQGQPNDYCRWVGVPSKDSEVMWACHNEKDPYVKMNPRHVTFSTGPANKLVPFVPELLTKKCGAANIYSSAKDPDLQNFIFDMQSPRILPNDHAQFRLEGRPR